jgi:hypothetical protein
VLREIQTPLRLIRFPLLSSLLSSPLLFSQGRLFDTRQEAEKAADKFGLIYEPDYDFYSDDASFDQSAYSDEVAEAVASASREIDDTPPAIEASASVSREIDLSRSE